MAHRLPVPASTAAAARRRRSDEDHVRDLIEQVLFTTPGERVNRPTFGSGLLQLVFAPNSDALAAATEMTVQARAAAVARRAHRRSRRSTSISEDATLVVDGPATCCARPSERRVAAFARAAPREATGLRYFCCDDRRRAGCAGRAATAQRDRLPRGRSTPTRRSAARQRDLRVHFVDARPAPLATATAIAPIARAGVRRPRHPCSTVDPSTSRRRRARSYASPAAATTRPTHCASSDSPAAAGFDLLLAAVAFSLQGRVPERLRLRAGVDCPPEPADEPEIDYLAKDYASFRQLMLDRRRAARCRRGRERNAADLGRRAGRAAGLRRRPAQLRPGRGRDRGVSRNAPGGAPRVRRHARAARLPVARRRNARAWVQLRVDRGRRARRRDAVPDARCPAAAPCSTGRRSTSTRSPLGPERLRDHARRRRLRGRNRDRVLHAGATECCLPAARPAHARRARWRTCESATFSCFEEVRGPATGLPRTPTRRIATPSG